MNKKIAHTITPVLAPIIRPTFLLLFCDAVVFIVGDTVRSSVSVVGPVLGLAVGPNVGLSVGMVVGFFVGMVVGAAVDSIVGISVGVPVASQLSSSLVIKSPPPLFFFRQQIGTVSAS